MTPSTICRRCSRSLKNPNSIKAGYGKKCYHKKLAGDLKQSRSLGTCTIVAPDLARKVIAAISRIVNRMDETIHPARWKCHVCGTTIQQMPIESIDHTEGTLFPGYGKPQWFILHDEHYDLAIWKIGITEELILGEMEAHGDIPEGWTREKVRPV